MHAAAINLRGGVSPRGTLLRGQSIIEYVLIIAVIGLVIVFAGPGVAGAIRNQFNLVGNTMNSGTSAGTEGGGAAGGGSAGADSATVQAAIAKDAKDWTLDEQKAVAEDIAAKGDASPAYAKAKAAMDAGTKFSVKLTNNVGGGSAYKNAAVTATSDKLFLLSYSEIVPTSHWTSSHPWTSSEGTQYEAFKGKVTNNYSGNDCLKIGGHWWERSADPNDSGNFLSVYGYGDPSGNNFASNSCCVCPAWCF